MKTYTHNPTTVEAVRVERPWKNISFHVPFAQMIKTQTGAFHHFRIATPGKSEVKEAFPGDWIIRYPTGCYEVMSDERFQRYYGDNSDAE